MLLSILLIEQIRRVRSTPWLVPISLKMVKSGLVQEPR